MSLSWGGLEGGVLCTCIIQSLGPDVDRVFSNFSPWSQICVFSQNFSNFHWYLDGLANCLFLHNFSDLGIGYRR